MTVETELRQDPATRNWVVIAPQRGRRPHDFTRTRQAGPGGPDCPFCPGSEAQTPPEVWRLDGPGGSWRVRVVPNRFAVLAGDGHARRAVSAQGFVSMAGMGRHEVVVESTSHTFDLATAEDGAVRDVLLAYRERYRALRAEGAALIVLFRNHGPGAGTSLAHPHSQIVATPVVPLEIRHRFEVAQQHYDDLGSCLYLDILERERSDGRRIVLETERYLAFQPFAAAYPFETWIMPRSCRPSFGQTDDASLAELAPVLRAVLGGLRRELDDPDYNYIVQSAPPGDEEHESFVWHIRIVPRLVRRAGFELGSGIQVNPTRPEETAAALRRAVEQETAERAQAADARRRGGDVAGRAGRGERA